MSAGVLILVLMLVRLLVRLATAQPRPAVTGSAFLDRVARLTHLTLYVLVTLMAASGIALAVQAGLPGIVFGGAGALPESFAGFRPRALHGVVSRLLLVLIALHVIAALYHQFVRRDGLLGRMSFSRR
jgi:cytochrome b561